MSGGVYSKITLLGRYINPDTIADISSTRCLLIRSPKTGVTMWIKLNTFQQTMRLWDQIYPYNAVHVVENPARLELTKLRQIINQYMRTNHIGGFSLDPRKQRFQHYGNQDIPISVLKQQGDITSQLHGEIQQQLNTPFALNHNKSPFRFFILANDKSFYLGLVYLHMVCAADNIIYLLRNITGTYLAGNQPPPAPIFSIQTRANARLHYLLVKHLPYWFITAPLRIIELCKSIRSDRADYPNYATGLSYFQIRPAQLQALLTTAKNWQVTLNDIFLAMLLKAMIPLATMQQTTKRRRISVGSIVNIRKDVPHIELADLGLFLGSFNISYDITGSTELEALSKYVREKTHKIKKNKLYLHTLLDMKVIMPIINLFFSKRLQKVYPKYYPLWGGITNVNLNTLWPTDNNVPGINYLRAVSTGPVTPLVLSITTVHDSVNIGMTFRKSVFSQTMINCIINTFTNDIASLSAAV